MGGIDNIEGTEYQGACAAYAFLSSWTTSNEFSLKAEPAPSDDTLNVVDIKITYPGKVKAIQIKKTITSSIVKDVIKEFIADYLNADNPYICELWFSDYYAETSPQPIIVDYILKVQDKNVHKISNGGIMGMLKKTKVKIFIGSTPPVEITDTKISLKSFEVLDDKKDEIEQAISDAFSIPKDSIISDMKRDILDNTQEYRRYKLVKSLELQSIQANILLDDSNDFFDRIRVTKLSNQHVNVMIELMLPRDDLSGHQLERLVKDIVEYIRTNMNRDINTEEMKKFVLKSCNSLTEKNFNTLDWKDHLFREGVYMKLSEQGDYSGFAEEFNG